MIHNVGDCMLGWIWNTEYFRRGYVDDTIFPPWVTTLQKGIIKSRIRLWIAHTHYVNDNNGNCVRPIRMYKHSSQFIYNKGKGGLDLGSEFEQKVRTPDKLSFKRKYVIRILDTVITNGWRIEQGSKVLLPYLRKLYDKNENITLKQLRIKLHSFPLENYINSASIELIKAFKSNDLYKSPSFTRELSSNVESIIHSSLTIINH